MKKGEASIWMKLLQPLMNERGEVGGEEGGDKGAQGDLEQAKAELANLHKELGAANEAKAGLEKKLGDADRELLSPEYLEWLDNRGRGGSTTSRDDAGGKGGSKGDDTVDWEEMPKAKIVETLSKQFQGNLEKVQDVLGKRLEDLEDKAGLAFAKVDIALARVRDPEYAFDDNRDAFYRVAKENPTWDASRVIKEVKRELREASEVNEAKEKERAEKERKALSEKATLPLESGQRHDMSETEAAETAYRQSFGNKE